MKRQWQIRRQFQPTADGVRRWDHAYQHLLRWSQPTEPTTAPDPSIPLSPQSGSCTRTQRIIPAGVNRVQ
jgi:hypothetical protein